ncbi:MAG: isoprenylcysteine carboxylmethyltransferase family protein, partial [Chloroflexota bacterium]|nr:isoprenylcysteine carboxylmethyltransferase family protein [Chloroflexota bacterium]
MSEQAQEHANVVAPPPLIYGGGLALGLLMQRLVPVRFGRTVARPVGVTLIVLNFVIGVPAFVTMRRARTSVRPDVPTTTLVTTGPFRYTRNPIYLSFVLLYTGIALLADALWPLLLLPLVQAVMNRGVIAREEAYLE